MIIKTIIEAIYERTSRVVNAEWAGKIAAHILDKSRHVRDPAAYCRAAIEAEADPRTRFLPVESP